MELREAINHARQQAGACETACQGEHAQLAIWLEELESLRTQLAECQKERDMAWSINPSNSEKVLIRKLAGQAVTQEKTAMTTTTQLNRVSEDQFDAADGRTMGREYGFTPNGNPLGGRWVLRAADGEFLDFDQYRHDLAERNSLRLHY